ncbi:MAG: universal stress protein [Janthinobacterium lividum]
MIKRAILVLDDSEVGRAARTYAIEFSKQHQIELMGVAVLDTPWLTAAQPEPLGGSAFKIRRDEEILRLTQSRITDLQTEFKNLCVQENVTFQSAQIEGFPANEIEVVASQGDLIIIGKTTHFHFDLDEDSDITVKHIAHDNPRPVITVPSVPASSQVVMVAYNGHIRSARALHMYLLLNLGAGKQIHLVHVNKDAEEGHEILSLASKLCASHGIQAQSHLLNDHHSTGDVLLEHARKLNA